MSQRANKSAIYAQTPSMKVSGLTKECLSNLRRGTSGNKTHLLGFMSECIQDEEEIKVPEVQQLCCYDRMKKLLIKNDDGKQERKQHESTLVKAMHIQAKMNVLQKQLEQKVSSNNKSISISTSKGTNSKINNNNNNSYNNSSMDIANNRSTGNLLNKKHKTQHISFKSGMLQRLRERGYEKFFEFEKIKKQTNMEKIKVMMGEQIESKFNKVMDEKDTQKRKLIEDNKLLQRRILQKNLQMQTLRQENTFLKENIKELQQKLFGANSEIQNAHLIKSYQKWLNEYKQHFGEMSIPQLSRYIQQMKNKCLLRFNQIQNKKEEKIIEISHMNDDKFSKLKKQLEKLQKRENQLVEVNRNLKLNREISQLEINELQRSKTQLINLRQLIVSVYSQWYEKRTDNEKQLMKSLNKLKENYSYDDMLNYMLFYDAKLSTNDKLNQYILKVLRGIQKIRKTIYPIQSNDKLDPFLVLDQIQLWVQKQIKHYQQINSNNTNVNTNVNSNGSNNNNNNNINGNGNSKNSTLSNSHSNTKLNRNNTSQSLNQPFLSDTPIN